MMGKLAAGPVVFLILAASISVRALASFEMEPRTSAEMGSATHMALGLLEDSFHLPYPDRPDSLDRMAIALHGFRPFGLTEMHFAAAWATLGLGASGHGVCLSYQRLGALSYLEETLLVRGVLRSGNLWFLPGVRFGVARLENRWMDSATLVDMTVIVRGGSGLRLLASAENPFAAAPIEDAIPCPSRVRVGAGYLVARHLAWGVEITKEVGQPVCVAAGVEGRVGRMLMLRSGLRSNPQEFCLGCGIALMGLTLDISTSFHLDLGSTHAVGITYRRR